ncbi:hypothetical protein TNCV_2251711 [Trichonephila clavipes]|nr:hypothetical protein TNCV_2251711 [Trichonephila clavipes]
MSETSSQKSHFSDQYFIPMGNPVPRNGYLCVGMQNVIMVEQSSYNNLKVTSLHQNVHLQSVPPHVDLYINVMANKQEKKKSCNLPTPSSYFTFLEYGGKYGLVDDVLHPSLVFGCICSSPQV